MARKAAAAPIETHDFTGDDFKHTSLMHDRLYREFAALSKQTSRGHRVVLGISVYPEDTDYAAQCERALERIMPLAHKAAKTQKRVAIVKMNYMIELWESYA